MVTAALCGTRHLTELEDQVRGQTRFARDLVTAMGETGLALKVEAIAILAQREELVRITGPVGPRLSPEIEDEATRALLDRHDAIIPGFVHKRTLERIRRIQVSRRSRR